MFLLLFILSLFLYFYRCQKMFAFDADQEFYANQYVQIVLGHKLTFLGIETSIGGMFVGPLYTYLNALIYWLFQGNPIGMFVTTLIFVSSQAGITYYLFTKLKGEKVGIISALIVLFSAGLWNKAYAPSAINFLYPMGLLFFYTLIKLKDNKRNFLYLGIILAASIQIHFSLFFFFPITVVFLLWQKLLKRKNVGNLLKVALMIIISSLPLIFFDLRHNFFITGNLWKFMTHNTGVSFILSIWGTLWGLAELFSHILTPSPGILVYVLLTFVLIFFVTRVRKDFIYKVTSLIFIVSIFLFIFYRGPKPDYFFYFLLAPFFLVVSDFIASLKHNFIKYPIYLILIFLLLQNLAFINTTLNHYNFRLKREVARYIKEQSGNRAVKISYDTELGLGFGFDYLLRHEGVNIDNDNSPEEYHIVLKNYANYPGKEFREPGSPVSIKVTLRKS